MKASTKTVYATVLPCARMGPPSALTGSPRDPKMLIAGYGSWSRLSSPYTNLLLPLSQCNVACGDSVANLAPGTCGPLEYR